MLLILDLYTYRMIKYFFKFDAMTRGRASMKRVPLS